MSFDTPTPSVLPEADQLRARLVGALVLPGEPDWVLAATPWNVTVRAQPLAVVLAANPDDVAAAVVHAARHGIRVAVHGPGHGASDTIGGALLIVSVLATYAIFPQFRTLDTTVRAQRVEREAAWDAEAAPAAGG